MEHALHHEEKALRREARHEAQHGHFGAAAHLRHEANIVHNERDRLLHDHHHHHHHHGHHPPPFTHPHHHHGHHGGPLPHVHHHHPPHPHHHHHHHHGGNQGCCTIL